MYKVLDEAGHLRGRAKDLYQAIEMAKLIDEFVTITDGSTEICGLFGVASVEQGICPDGFPYTWKKRRD
jgi:hypothetical protein